MLVKLQLCIFRVSARGQKKKWSQVLRDDFTIGFLWEVRGEK